MTYTGTLEAWQLLARPVVDSRGTVVSQVWFQLSAVHQERFYERLRWVYARGPRVSSLDKQNVFGNTFDDALEYSWLHQAIIKLESHPLTLCSQTVLSDRREIDFGHVGTFFFPPILSFWKIEGCWPRQSLVDKGQVRRAGLGPTWMFGQQGSYHTRLACSLFDLILETTSCSKPFRERGKGKKNMQECLELCFTEMSLLGGKYYVWGDLPVLSPLPFHHTVWLRWVIGGQS